MKDFEGRMHTTTEESLERLTVKRKTQKMFPCEETVFIWVLSKLLEHAFNFLHVKLGLDFFRSTKFEIRLVIFIDGK